MKLNSIISPELPHAKRMVVYSIGQRFTQFRVSRNFRQLAVPRLSKINILSTIRLNSE